MYSTVLTSSRSRGIGNGLTYETKDAKVVPGALVTVPLRKQSVEGVVLEVTETRPQEMETVTMKEVERIVSDQTLLGPAQMQTMRWMADEYCCTLRQAATVFLPPPPWSALLPREIIGYSAGRRPAPEDIGRAKKQQIALDYLAGKDWVAREEWQRATGVSATIIRSLLEKKLILEERKAEHPSSGAERYKIHEKMLTLTAPQKRAYDQIISDERPVLLFGVTGSGKTHLYAKLIADTARIGKQTIMLVPEILLTDQTIRRFEELFDRSRIAVLHSRLTASARRAEWRRIRSGDAALVIGSRSALFAPCRNLGLIVIDEEHEWTYKNEQTPRYHARETAEALCRFTGARLVLGSATPSVESWSRAKEGRYHLVRLAERFSGLEPVTVRVIDLATTQFGNTYPFSPPLLAAIDERLKRGEQSVLFLNRRGMATSILCLQCRRRVVSPESQMPYTVHRTRDGRPFLLDHVTGISADLPAVCPACQSPSLRAVGAGTQRLEDILAGVFPNARVLRADSDTLKHPEQMRRILQSMEERQADILLGTQSVVKGLHLPGVTLAAVLLADIGLSIPHFRAGERVFQLLSQLAGRSGRTQAGEVIIQTFRPEAPEIIAAAMHKTEEYLEEEWKMRSTLGYPPATRMIRLVIAGEDAGNRTRVIFGNVLQHIREQRLSIIATSAPTLFGAGRIWHILLRGANPRAVLPFLDLSDVTVDVDPIECV